MTELDKRFKWATEIAKLDIGFKPETTTLLKSYALYKQATLGDIEGERPDDMVGAAKYTAWEQLEGMEPDEAKKQYVALVEEIRAK